MTTSLSRSYELSRITPVVRYRGKSLELVLDERLSRPLLRMGGAKAEKIYRVLSSKFLTRDNRSAREILVPLQYLPAVSVWLVASYRKVSEELLDNLMTRTPRLLADLVWDLVDLSKNVDEQKQLIEYRMALRASKIVNELLKLYNLDKRC